MPLAKAGGITEFNNGDNDMSEQNENFLQRHRESQREYNLELVDTLATAVQELRDRLTTGSPEDRGVAEGFMTTDSRAVLRDAEGLIWKLSWDIDQKRWNR